MNNYEEEISQLKERVATLEEVVKEQSKKLSSLNNQTTSLNKKNTNTPIPKQTLSNNINNKKNKEQGPWLDKNLEALIGGTWLNRIGIVAFVIGMGFFLKYAFDNQWIGPTGRIIIGLLIGVGFLVSGEGSQKKDYKVFAQGLTGGGIAILYFSIFAAFNFYNLIGQIPAFGIMVLITTTAVLLSVRYNSLAIAILGIVGGFLTPFMLSTGETKEVALFTYIAILDLGVLTLAYFKKWHIINIISFVLTQVVILLWLFGDYVESEIWMRQSIISIFFIIFAVLAFIHNIVHKHKTNPDDLVLIGLNAAIFFGLSYLNLQQNYHWLLGYFAVLMSIIYFGLGYLTLRANKEDRLLIMSFLGIALTFLTIAIPIQLHGRWITIAWAVEGFVLLWTGFNQRNFRLRQVSWLIYVFVVLRLISFDSVLYFYSNSIYYPIVNWQGLTYLFGIASIWSSAVLYKMYPDVIEPEEKYFSVISSLLGNVMILFFLTSENQNFYNSLWNQSEYQQSYWLNDAKQLTLSAIWGIYSIILIVIGIIKKYQPIRIFSIVLFAITILKVFLFDLSNLDTIYRIGSFIGLGVILILVSFLYQRFRSQIMDLVGSDDNKEEFKN